MTCPKMEPIGFEEGFADTYHHTFVLSILIVII
jgi:hypothetical protein